MMQRCTVTLRPSTTPAWVAIPSVVPALLGSVGLTVETSNSGTADCTRGGVDCAYAVDRRKAVPHVAAQNCVKSRRVIVIPMGAPGLRSWLVRDSSVARTGPVESMGMEKGGTWVG